MSFSWYYKQLIATGDQATNTSNIITSLNLVILFIVKQPLLTMNTTHSLWQIKIQHTDDIVATLYPSSGYLQNICKEQNGKAVQQQSYQSTFQNKLRRRKFPKYCANIYTKEVDSFLRYNRWYCTNMAWIKNHYDPKRNTIAYRSSMNPSWIGFGRDNNSIRFSPAKKII